MKKFKFEITPEEYNPKSPIDKVIDLYEKFNFEKEGYTECKIQVKANPLSDISIGNKDSHDKFTGQVAKERTLPIQKTPHVAVKLELNIHSSIIVEIEAY